MDFNGFKFRSFSADGFRVVSDKVFTSGDLGSVRFIFFWADGRDNSRVSDCPSNWDLGSSLVQMNLDDLPKG